MCLKDNTKPSSQGSPAAGTDGEASESLEGKMVTRERTENERKIECQEEDHKINIHVRDVSSANRALSKATIILQPNVAVSKLISNVGSLFKYEASSFDLIFQRTNGEQVELGQVDPKRSLLETGFDCSQDNRNSVTLCDAGGQMPKRVTEDELSLGASASPTSSIKNWLSDEPTTSQVSTSDDVISAGYCNTVLYSNSSIKQDTGYVGLVNQAMTCYLNSLLQTLFMTPEFRNALYRWEFTGSEEDASKNIPFQMQRLFLQLQTATRSAVETTNLTKSFGWDSSEAWQQHDIQELCRVMFDALEHSFKNTSQADLINNLYQGKMKDYVTCLDCRTENAREDSFLDIPLPIRPFGSVEAYRSLEEALKAFVEPEVLTGNNKYECTKCGTLCDAHKGLKFSRFPYLLTCHLKRFDFDYQTFHRIKLNDKITFPSMLDLNSFIGGSTKEDKIECTKEEACQTSPEKSAVEKLDDASTADSGSALDTEESSSVELASSTPSQNDLDGQDEDEGIDVSSMYNEKNKLSVPTGPYTYELFSIMIHSGSASGGHYYVYIKDFITDEWFCYNDQNVSRITYDDIRRTYGGSVSRGYYTGWTTSSANAYMLMYRQADKNRNCNVFSKEEFPTHIKKLVQKMAIEEAAEKEARELERFMCKVKVFCRHPKLNVMIEKKLRIHQETTLAETTKVAYEELGLVDEVPLERCRLVKYEELHDSIESSFTNDGNELISEVLGGVRNSYKFSLLLEIREENQMFEQYKPGGTTVKVHIVNIDTEEVEGPFTVRASQDMSVLQFKELIGKALSLDHQKMRVVQERYYNEMKPLNCNASTLKFEGFNRSSKVYCEASGQESVDFFNGSIMYNILDRYDHTITIYCNLPEVNEEILAYLQIDPYSEEVIEDEESKISLEAPTSESCASNVDTNVASDSMCTSTSFSILSTSTSVTSSLSSVVTSSIVSPSSSDASSNLPTQNICSFPISYSQTPCSVFSPLNAMLATPIIAGATQPPTLALGASANLSDNEDEGIVDIDPTVSTVNSDQSASEDSSLTSDSDRTLVGDPPEDNFSETSHSPDYHNVSSPEESPKDKENIACMLQLGGASMPLPDENWDEEYYKEEKDIKRYFRAFSTDGPKVLRIAVDKRITHEQLKRELQPYVGVAEKHFKIYKLFSNSSEEYECTRPTETLNSYLENAVIIVRLSRALLPGEYKGKVFSIDFDNTEDPAKFLLDFVICQGDSVSKVKEVLVKEINNRTDINLTVDKVRLRKKSWKNPQTIYLDSQVFEKDIALYSNWEIYLQVLEDPEIKKDDSELCLFAKRWRPSTYTTDPLLEFIVGDNFITTLKQQLSSLSGIAVENVMFCKGKGTFPCDQSVLDIESDLDWTERTGSLDQKNLFIMDDGCIIYYKDKTETLQQLTDVQRRELTSEENTRLNREQPFSTQINVTKFKEKGLKIYLNPNN